MFNVLFGGPFTLFVPNQLVIGNMSLELQESLLDINNLKYFISYHVFKDAFNKDQLYDGQQLTALDGRTAFVNKKFNWQKDELQIWIQGRRVRVNLYLYLYIIS